MLRFPRISKFEFRSDLGDARAKELNSICDSVQAEEVLIELPYTENDPRLRRLRAHASFGQIAPHAMRRMRPDDLEYLAGAVSVDNLPQGITAEAKIKLVENAKRPERVLNHRALFWATSWGTLAAAAAGAALIEVLNWVL